MKTKKRFTEKEYGIGAVGGTDCILFYFCK